jgi:aromatic-L-amino-acid decarboxylase
MLNQTVVNGIVCIRLSIGAERTAEKHIRNAYSILEEESQLALGIWEQKRGDENV